MLYPGVTNLGGHASEDGVWQGGFSAEASLSCPWASDTSLVNRSDSQVNSWVGHLHLTPSGIPLVRYWEQKCENEEEKREEGETRRRCELRC